MLLSTVNLSIIKKTICYKKRSRFVTQSWTYKLTSVEGASLGGDSVGGAASLEGAYEEKKNTLFKILFNFELSLF
jgi:hypothetical protein